MSKETKRGHHYNTTVEITFEGRKVRVSPDVKKAIEKRDKIRAARAKA